MLPFDYRGVIIGITAGIACAVNIVWVSRRVQAVHPFVIVFYQSIIAAVIIFGLLIKFDYYSCDKFRLVGVLSDHSTAVLFNTPILFFRSKDWLGNNRIIK